MKENIATEFGTFKISLNGKEIQYNTIELPNQSYCFKVDKRYKVICKIPKGIKGAIRLICGIKTEGKDLTSYPETGENLALISCYCDDNKLSIGTKGDIQGIKYNYLDCAIEMVLENAPREVIFYIAWLKISNPEKEDIYTWFAADPALMCKSAPTKKCVIS